MFTTQYVELFEGACEDCVIAIANNDYSGMSDQQRAATRAGIARIGKYLIVREPMGFMWSKCAVCGGLAGDRHEVGYMEAVR